MKKVKIFQPLDQFDIFLLQNISEQNFLNIFFKFFVNFDFFFFNIFVYFSILLFFFIFFFNLIIYKRLKIFFSSIWQYILENFFIFIYNLTISQVGKSSQIYIVYICNIFVFILFSNIIGLLPFSFTITSHIIITFMLGASSIIGLTIIGFMKQKMDFINLFIPKGVPSVMLPMLVFIEVVSYIARGFSLAIRLFANLMSGHSLLHILLFFLTKILNFSFFIGLLGFILILTIFVLEIGISFLQAYVFAVLISIYLKDSFHSSH